MKFNGMLRNAPLLYVLSSVGYPPVLEIRARIPEIQERLRHHYPLLEITETQNVTINVENDKAATVTETSSLWHFFSIDKAWVVTLDSQKVLLHTSGYSRFQEFQERFSYVLGILRDVLLLDYCLYQGIRYVDLINPKSGESLSQYLPPAMLVAQIDGVAGRQMDGFAGASFVTEHGRLGVRCWMNPPQVWPPDLIPVANTLGIAKERPFGEFAILDMDHGSRSDNPRAFDVLEIVKSIDEMHKVCHKAFEQIPLPHAFAVWERIE